VAGLAWLKRNNIDDQKLLLRALPFMIPLPYIAIQAGWIVAEVGRQPWIVYGLMRTSDAVSPVQPGQVGTSLVAMVLIYTLLGAAGIYLMARAAKKGPSKA
jgi:cytochrome d ubiquinol oxidase subunit I